MSKRLSPGQGKEAGPGMTTGHAAGHITVWNPAWLPKWVRVGESGWCGQLDRLKKRTVWSPGLSKQKVGVVCGAGKRVKARIG